MDKGNEMLHESMSRRRGLIHYDPEVAKKLSKFLGTKKEIVEAVIKAKRLWGRTKFSLELVDNIRKAKTVPNCLLYYLESDASGNLGLAYHALDKAVEIALKNKKKKDFKAIIVEAPQSPQAIFCINHLYRILKKEIANKNKK